MKKIFVGIGILSAFFSIYFFLLVADKMVYLNDETIYDFELSHSVDAEELNKLAKQIDVTIRLVDFKDTSFGKKELYITFINPNEEIELGKRQSVFLNENVVYQEYNAKSTTKIKYFTIQCNNQSKINMISSLLNESGYEVNVEESESIKFNLNMLFSSFNLLFFALLTILLTLSISSFYIYRLKEIGILKLNGWSNIRIVIRLLRKPLVYIYLSAFGCIIPFGIYVAMREINKIFLYVEIYISVSLFMFFIFIFAMVLGDFFVDNINQISAIKNKKNNQLLFYVLLIFKVVIVTLLVFSINKTTNIVKRLDATLCAINQLEEYNFYKIRTAVVPDQKVFDELNQLIQSIDDEHVYNYSPPDEFMSAEKLSQIELKKTEVEKFIYTEISCNMLEILGIVDIEGNVVNESQIDESGTLLIPIHYKTQKNKILDYYQVDENIKIIYIQDKQIKDDILFPGYYVFDSIYRIQPLEKKLYINRGEVLFDEDGANILEEALNKMQLDKYSITTEPLNSDYNMLKANNSLELVESTFHLVINSMSYILCIFAIITIYCELKKKEFGVYKLLGRYPIKVVTKFMVVQCIITVTITLILNRKLIVLLVIETILYMLMIYKYMKHKAVVAIKGK